MKTLHEIAGFVSEKIDSSDIELKEYVTTDNLLQNKEGVSLAISLPLKNTKLTKYKEGDVLISNIRPYLKKIWFANKSGGCSNDVLVFRAKTKNDPQFLHYVLFQNKFFDFMMSGAKGTKMPRGDKSQMMNFLVPNFDLPTQQKIAKILAALDRKIALNNQINAELEKMAKTLYDYWFVQFDFPDENDKPYKSSGGKMVWNNVLKRDVPLGWEDGIIENNLAKVPNSNKIQSKEIKFNGKIPVIDQSQDYICGFTNDDNSILVPNDAHIIFGDHTRKVKLVNFPYARGADGTQIIISNNERLPNYLFYQMILEIDLSNYGYARHYKFLKESRILIPQKEIAQKFNQKVSSFFDLWKINLKQTQTLTQYRDFLLPMLMNGQVEIL